ARGGSRAADGASTCGRILTGEARAVALIQRARVAVVGACRSSRPHQVGGTGRAVPGAELRAVAGPGRCPTLEAGRREAVRRTRRARTVAVLGEVADAGRRAAQGPGVPGRVLAGCVRAVALVEGAGVAVNGAGGARAGAGSHEIAWAARWPADRRGGQERAARGAAGAAVALLSGIDDPVAAAAGAAVPAADAAPVERLAAVRQVVAAARRLRHGNTQVDGAAAAAVRDVRVALDPPVAHAAVRVHQGARDDEVDRRRPGRARELGRPDADDQAVARGRILVDREHSGLHSRRVLKRQVDAVVPGERVRAVHPDTHELDG